MDSFRGEIYILKLKASLQIIENHLQKSFLLLDQQISIFAFNPRELASKKVLMVLVSAFLSSLHDSL